MSRILSKNKQYYQKAIFLEGLFLLSAILSFAIFKQAAFDVSFGLAAAFLPFWLFQFLVLRETKIFTKMTAIYRAEGAKFSLTFLGIGCIFKFALVSSLGLFFVGFLLGLLLNNLLPLLFHSFNS